MSGLFGGAKASSQKNKAVSALQVQTSTYGPVLPLVYGKNRIAGNLGWYGNWIATSHTDKNASGGKGGGGGGGSSTSYTYTTGVIILLAEGQTNGIGTVWKEKELHTTTDLGFTVFNGATPQTAWTWLTSFNPSQAVAYSGMSYVAASALQLGSNTSLPNFNFELKGLQPFNAGTVDDALPSGILTDYLTDANHGAGFGGFLGSTTSLRNYCLARSLFMSPIEDQQRTAADFVNDMATWCNFAPVWSYNQLLLLPYGDTAITSSYGSYTPAVTPLYDLGPDDFLYEDSSDSGVEVDWKDLDDCHNVAAIEYCDRTNSYNKVTQTAKDQADIDARGSYPMSNLSVNGITDAQTAKDVAQLVLQRDLYIRKTYSFQTGVRYMRLEPMDVVTLTDPNAGLNRELVRITKAAEQDDVMSFEAEELPIGAAHAPTYAPQSGGGYAQDYNVSPGSVSPPVIFNAPGLLTGTGFETWIAVAGIGAFWGGCDVYASEDNTTYKRVGRITAPARYGALTANMAAGTDPDTTSTFNVSLLSGQLTAGTTADADNWRQMAFVGGASGGEFIAFKNATLTGTLSYSLGGYLRRGGYGSSSQAHVTTDVFARIDDAIFRLPYESGKRGATTWFKFVSFNTFGSGQEQLSAVTAYSHVLGASDVLASPKLFDQLAGQYAVPSSGSNFVPNPSFEINNIGATGTIFNAGQPVCDSWYVLATSTGYGYSIDASFADVGLKDLSINLSGTPVPASATVGGQVASAPIYVQAGQLISISGDIRSDSAGGNPAALSFAQQVNLFFYNASGTFISSTGAGPTQAANSPSGAYANFAKNQFTVPAGTSYALAVCALYVTNSSASPVTVASWAARFDNLFGLFVTAAGQVNYATGQTVDSLKPAQVGADVTAAQTGISVCNPQFVVDTSGWTFDYATGFYQENGANSPDSAITTYLVRQGQSGHGTTVARNLGYVAVQVGQTVIATCCIKAFSCNAGSVAQVRISWRDINHTELSVALASVTCGPGGTYLQCVSKAMGQAPAGAQFAHLELYFISHTSGYFTATSCNFGVLPSSVDEVPDGATYVRQTQLSATASSLTIDNATFQMALAAGGGIPGWSTGSAGASVFLQSTGPLPSVGGQYVVLLSGAGGGAALAHKRSFAVNPGDRISVGGLLYAASGQAQITANFYTSGGGFISAVAVATSTAAWFASSASGAVPSNAATMVLSCNQNVASSYGVFNYVWCSINDVRVAGSGARLGDLRNTVARGVLNVPAQVPSVISASWPVGTTSPCVVSLSVAAFTVLAGSYTVAYSALSTSASQTRNTTVTYYLYFDDPAQAGGTPTLVATTTLANIYGADGRVYVGGVAVTVPTSGSGSGGGSGGGSCVAASSWLPTGVTAGEASKCSIIVGTDGALGLVDYSVDSNIVEMQPCMRLVTESGASITASRSTPMTLIDGSLAMFPDMLGELVVVRRMSWWRRLLRLDHPHWERVTGLFDAGMLPVAHISIGGNVYLAGDVQGVYIATHNLIAPK